MMERVKIDFNSRQRAISAAKKVKKQMVKTESDTVIDDVDGQAITTVTPSQEPSSSLQIDCFSDGLQNEENDNPYKNSESIAF